MQQTKNQTPFSNLKILVISAILTALSIVFGKYLAINIGESIRFSFENLPLLIAGLYLGPITGMAVGIAADLLGCVLVGYSINPIITLGAAMIGLIAGYCGKLIRSPLPRTLAAAFFSHAVGSVFIKTVGLSLFYQMPFGPTVALRSVTYAIVFALESAILWLLSKSRSFEKQLASFRK